MAQPGKGCSAVGGAERRLREETRLGKGNADWRSQGSPQGSPSRLVAAERAATAPSRTGPGSSGEPWRLSGGECCPNWLLGERRCLSGTVYPEPETLWLQKTKSNNAPLFHPAKSPAPAPAPAAPASPNTRSGTRKESRHDRRPSIPPRDPRTPKSANLESRPNSISSLP